MTPEERAALASMLVVQDAAAAARSERDCLLPNRAAAIAPDVLRGLQLLLRHLDEGGHDWREGTAMADVTAARQWLESRRPPPAPAVVRIPPDVSGERCEMFHVQYRCCRHGAHDVHEALGDDGTRYVWRR